MTTKFNKKTRDLLKAAESCHTMEELAKYLKFTPDEESRQFQVPLNIILQERVELIRLPPKERGQKIFEKYKQLNTMSIAKITGAGNMSVGAGAANSMYDVTSSDKIIDGKLVFDVEDKDGNIQGLSLDLSPFAHMLK